jgi:hypothetical protein
MIPRLNILIGVVWLGSLLFLTLAHAQNNGPQVGYVYPAGCKQGTTVTVIVGGRQMPEVSAVYFSGTGLTAKVIGQEKPLSQEDRVKLRDELTELKKKDAPPSSGDRIKEIDLLLAQVQRGAVTPALQDTVMLEVTAAPDATIGRRDLRLLGKSGLSIPLVFMVGDLREVSFPSVSAITPRPAAGSSRAVAETLSGALSVTLPVVVNGQILPGETDRIRFAGRRGEKLVVAVHARALIPYLADAVPGWFQAAVSLLDAEGRELAYADDFRYQADPVLAYQLPGDGDYTLVVQDSLHRGREDFVYRVAIGELPFISGMFPLGGVPGREIDFALNGWNLPAQVRHTRLPAEEGVRSLDVGRCASATGKVEVAVDDLPECGETESNDTNERAQVITLPMIVNGRIERVGDEDWFQFKAKAGEALVVDVMARRLRSPLDGTLQVFDPRGGVLAANDDNDDKADGLSTHHADPRVPFTVPEDGTYRVRLADAQHRGGRDYTYRLRVGAPRPDFALRMVPSSATVRPGGSAKVTVFAMRYDGFAGEITLALHDAPAGYRLSKAIIPGNADRVELTLNTPKEAAGDVVALEMDGSAGIAGAGVQHRAVPADDRMQAFFYRHLVPACEWQVGVRKGGK